MRISVRLKQGSAHSERRGCVKLHRERCIVCRRRRQEAYDPIIAKTLKNVKAVAKLSKGGSLCEKTEVTAYNRRAALCHSR